MISNEDEDEVEGKIQLVELTSQARRSGNSGDGNRNESMSTRHEALRALTIPFIRQYRQN